MYFDRFLQFIPSGVRRLSVLLVLMGAACTQENVSFSSEDLTIQLNGEGKLTGLIAFDDVNYLALDSVSYLIQVREHGTFSYPQKMEVDANNLRFHFGDETIVDVRVEEFDSHLKFSLVAISNDAIDLVQWGPFQTTISKTIGETVGVVRGTNVAIGIQSLNPKTLGGYPWNENDAMPQFDIFDADDYTDMSEEGKGYTLYRVEAAKPTRLGSSMQAYVRNRHTDGTIKNWGQEAYVSPAYDDGGPEGSSIALFASPVAEALDAVGTIELAEGLPHPMIDGEWGKQARSASAAYMIMGFDESNIEQCLAYTKAAGLRYLYHGGPFETWGHFKLNSGFPNGRMGLKTCVEIAKKEEIFLGVHTLSNFITTNDAYVSPIPDPRLARVGSTTLAINISASDTELPIDDPLFFSNLESSHLKTVRLNEELIRYESVSQEAPWRLLNCQRGAFGTRPAAHGRGERVDKLADHAYKVFLTDPSLGAEVAQNLATLFNETGLRQISFDGVEGNRSTGMGNYGEILFTKAWFDNLSDEIRSHYIADASRTSHYFWHMYTRMNWGEPWYADFRESQTAYRLKNQQYFQRNMMPGMLGWFSMRNTTSLEDIEWMLARSAAFNAGYAFVTSIQVLEENKLTPQILERIATWEQARMANLFSSDQRKRMEDIGNEFTLTANNWTLTQIYSHKFTHERKVRQPGEPVHSLFSFENPVSRRGFHFVLEARSATVSDITLELDNFKQISLPITLQPGQRLRYTGGRTAGVYSPSWEYIQDVTVNEDDFDISEGGHQLLIDATFTNYSDEARLKVEVRIPGDPESLAEPSL